MRAGKEWEVVQEVAVPSNRVELYRITNGARGLELEVLVVLAALLPENFNPERRELEICVRGGKLSCHTLDLLTPLI